MTAASPHDPRPALAPPNAQQVAEYLKRHRPRRTNGALLFNAVALVALFLALTLVEPGGWSGLLPWAILAVLLAWSIRRTRVIAAIARQTVDVYELTLLHRWDHAVERAWSLLPRLSSQPQTHGQVASLLGAALARLQHHDAAIAAFDHLLRYLPPDNPAGRYIRLQRLHALLHADRLTDANDELAKLSRADLGPLEAAHLALAKIEQSVHTHHLDELIADAESHMDRLRPLGVDAAPGYALVAAAMLRSGLHDEAARWWHRATLLRSSDQIVWEAPAARELASLEPAPSLAAVLGGPA